MSLHLVGDIATCTIPEVPDIVSLRLVGDAAKSRLPYRLLQVTQVPGVSILFLVIIDRYRIQACVCVSLILTIIASNHFLVLFLKVAQ